MSAQYQIIILNGGTQSDSSFYVTGVFWLAANSNDIVPQPSFISSVPFIDPADLSALQAGTIVEQPFNTGAFPVGTSLATVQSTILTMHAAAQTAYAAVNPVLANMVGIAYTGSTWTTSSPFAAATQNVIVGPLNALNSTVIISVASMESVGLQIAAGTFIGGILAETSFDGGLTWNETYLNMVTDYSKQLAIVYGSANSAQAATIIVNGGAGLVRVRAFTYTSGTCNVTLRASNIIDTSTGLATSEATAASPPQITVIGGLSAGGALGAGITRPQRMDRAGNQRDGSDVLMAHDAIEGTNVNSWLWTQVATTMTIVQTTGVLTLNNGGSVATTVDAILTSTRQFPLFNHGILKFCMRSKAVAGPTNAFIELGFGAPVGTTAIVNNGAFFRLNGTQLYTVTSFNGTENAIAQSVSVSASEYYLFMIYMHDDFAHFVIEDTGGIPILDAFVTWPTTVTGPSAVSHLPAFARVYNSAAVATAAKLNIGSYDTVMLDLETGKPWSHQMAATGRSANVNPTTFAQTVQLAPGAAPTTTTPTNAACAYATLGGEFVLNGTASSENLLGVFGFQVPSPYTFHITDITLPQPFVTSAMGATVNIQEWCIMVASSNNPSTASGQRYPLGMFSAVASAAVGTVFNGLPLDLDLGTPIVVQPGQFVLVLVKVISGAASGVYRGACSINGYYE